jgi:hypothetical protein
MLSKDCVACGARNIGYNHHCSAGYENRRHAAENAERDDPQDRRGYGSRLEDGFGRMGYDDSDDLGWWVGL